MEEALRTRPDVQQLRRFIPNGVHHCMRNSSHPIVEDKVRNSEPQTPKPELQNQTGTLDTSRVI